MVTKIWKNIIIIMSNHLIAIYFSDDINENCVCQYVGKSRTSQCARQEKTLRTTGGQVEVEGGKVWSDRRRKISQIMTRRDIKWKNFTLKSPFSWNNTGLYNIK